MKKIFIALALFCALFFTTNKASAVIIYSTGEKIEIVKELPDSAIIDNHHVNLGVMYDQFSIFWIPLWNYGETKFVLVNDKKNYYYDLDEEDIQMIRDEFGVKIPNKPKIGFWNKIGGKLVLITLIAGIILFRGGNSEDEEDVDEGEEDISASHPGA